MMGPDCGTAIINGVPLGFANVVARGPVGIVAASGTGLQEISSIVTNQGLGISQAIGTGGRDVQAEVGGVMFLMALEALAADEQTRVIVLAGKPPAAEVLARIEAKAAEIEKPLVNVFLGAAASGPRAASTLTEAAQRAVTAMGLQMFSSSPASVLTAVRVPKGIDGNALVKKMRDEYGVTVAGGQESLKGKIVRIAHMGYMGRFDIIVALSALEMALKELGHDVTPGCGVAAAEEVFLARGAAGAS